MTDAQRTALARSLADTSGLLTERIYGWLCMARDDVPLVQRAIKAEATQAGEGERLIYEMCLGVESGVRHGPVGPQV